MNDLDMATYNKLVEAGQYVGRLEEDGQTPDPEDLLGVLGFTLAEAIARAMRAVAEEVAGDDALEEAFCKGYLAASACALVATGKA